MSMYTRVYAMESRVEAPEIGDSGFVEGEDTRMLDETLSQRRPQDSATNQTKAADSSAASAATSGGTADTNTAAEADTAAARVAEENGVGQQPDSQEPSQQRSTLVKIRDTIIVVFLIWLGIRALYHLTKWLIE